VRWWFLGGGDAARVVVAWPGSGGDVGCAVETEGSKSWQRSRIDEEAWLLSSSFFFFCEWPQRSLGLFELKG